MDINKAKEIISVLAEGVDPTTGEVLESDNVCNKSEVVRALYTVLEVLNKKTQNNLPENAGKPWTPEEENQLKELYNKGLTKKEISKELCRTPGSISSRLVRLGLVE